MARIRFEDEDNKIHVVDTEDGSYLEEQLIYGRSNDYIEFSVYLSDDTEIPVLEEVFYKLRGAGLKEKEKSRVWFEALDNNSYVLNPLEKYVLRTYKILSNERDYTKFYLYAESTYKEIGISSRVFECLKDKGFPIENN